MHVPRNIPPWYLEKGPEGHHELPWTNMDGSQRMKKLSIVTWKCKGPFSYSPRQSKPLIIKFMEPMLSNSYSSQARPPEPWRQDRKICDRYLCRKLRDTVTGQTMAGWLFWMWWLLHFEWRTQQQQQPCGGIFCMRSRDPVKGWCMQMQWAQHFEGQQRSTAMPCKCLTFSLF